MASMSQEDKKNLEAAQKNLVDMVSRSFSSVVANGILPQPHNLTVALPNNMLFTMELKLRRNFGGK